MLGGARITFPVVSWLQVDDSDGVRVLTLDRPEVKNAIPHDGWRDLLDAFSDFEQSDSRVLVVTGAGGHFCSGAQLDPARVGELITIGDRNRRMKLVEATATALHRISKPTIAAVDGASVGAGMNLALGCDMVLATTRARFAELFVRRGLTVDFGGTWLLPRVVGLQRAKELCLSGRMVEAEEALSMGLVLELVAPKDLLDRARALAVSFLDGAPMAQMFAKQMINASYESSFAQTLSWEGQSQAIVLGTEDAVEGIAAFIEKRLPEWKGT